MTIGRSAIYEYIQRYTAVADSLHKFKHNSHVIL